MENLYSTLNIHQSASIEEIKKAYRILALKYHPDKNKEPNASKKFIEITNAYEILKDPIKRKIYDENLISDSLVKIAKEYESWQKESESKANFYSKMNYKDFEINLNKELKILLSNAPNFGCLAFIIFGFILSFWMLYRALNENKEGMVGGSVLNIIVYGLLVIWLYPKFTKKYSNERKDIYK